MFSKVIKYSLGASLAAMVVLTGCGKQATPSSNIASNGPDVVPATYTWFDGEADKGHQYVTIGLHNFDDRLSIAVYKSKRAAERGEKAIYAREFASQKQNTQLLDTVGNVENDEDITIGLMTSKIDPNNLKYSAIVSIEKKDYSVKVLKKMP